MQPAKYGNWSSGEELHANHNSFFMWKEIYQHASEVLGQVSWILDNDKLIGLLQDISMVELPLSCWPTFISMDIDNQTWVADLF